MKFFKITNHTGRPRYVFVGGVKIFVLPPKRIKCPKSLVSCEIRDYKEYIKNGTVFPHLLGIVISYGATIGKNCVIYQNVTIGSKDKYLVEPKSDAMYPVIGNNVTIYAGAVIVGPVKIGDNAIIGANSVVLNDVPKNTVVAGIPARPIKR